MDQGLPTGVRFYPTEPELVGFYLRNKLERRRPDMERFIPVVDVYNYEPTELPLVSGEASVRDPEQWFFFCPRQPREAQGGRPTRTTGSGYWKATGSPTPVFHNRRIIGIRKTMVFYQGRAPTGRKTAWKMNEYRAAEEASASASASTNLKWRSEFSLCRVYKKSGHLRSFDRRPIVRVERENTGGGDNDDDDMHDMPPVAGMSPSHGHTASTMRNGELSLGSSPSDGQDPILEGDGHYELEELDWDSLVGCDEI